jgi:cysteine synthase
MHSSILATVGGTPVVRLGRIAPRGVHLYAKLEAFNPTGSVKDRMALAAIEAAERSGALCPGQTVVEASSGNTGLSLAMVCAARGYPLVVVMAEPFSVERRRLMRFMGARVVLTPAALKGSGMIAKARELAATHGWFFVDQFDNPANVEAHVRGTAREILAQFHGVRLDAFVTGAGTGGTLAGVARVLRQARPDCRIIVCEPDNAPMLASGIPQPRAIDGQMSSHPLFRPHPMQGWSPDFIPGATAVALADGLVDQVLAVDGGEAMRQSRELARREGILTGISGGATLAGALQVAAGMPAGGSVLCMLPDTGERYLSTPLFEEIGADMDDAEWEISRSTPAARFDRPLPTTLPSPTTPMPDAADDGALARLLDDPARPTLMFALAWCEYCWAVRRLFERLGAPLDVIELDAPAHAADAGALRARLHTLTGSPTLPQVFVGGQWIGGCSETFEALADGSLAQRLAGLGLPCRLPPGFDPAQLLPTWRQPRAPA